MSVKLLIKHHLKFRSLKGSCTGSTESIWSKYHIVGNHTAQLLTVEYVCVCVNICVCVCVCGIIEQFISTDAPVNDLVYSSIILTMSTETYICILEDLT